MMNVLSLLEKIEILQGTRLKLSLKLIGIMIKINITELIKMNSKSAIIS